MQRTDEREPSTTDVSFDADGFDPTGSESPERRGGSGSDGRLGGLFSPKAFLGAFLLSVLGALVGGAIPIVGVVGRFVGLFAAGFGVGLLAERRRYAEVGLAGALTSGVLLLLTTFAGGFVFAPLAVELFAQYGLAVAGVGAAAGLLASVIGHYFGRDLRDGLTREI